MTYSKTKEETLDPENWDEMRKLGHKILDDMIDWHQEIRTRKTQYIPTKDNLSEILVPLTDQGEGTKQVYESVLNNVLPNLMITNRPKFWAMVAGTGSTYGMLAQMIATATNCGLETTPFTSGHLNNQVIEWIKELIGYPREAGGVIVSGGSEANFTALAVARNAMARVDMKADGLARARILSPL